jgi:peptide deformylase
MNRKPKLLDVRIIGDDILRQKAQPVTVFDEGLRSFVKDMIHTMYERDGVGLAAPQVGKSLRIFVMDMDWSKENAQPNPVVLINPHINSAEGEYEMEEGCISVPGVYAKVRRFNKVTYTYLDIEGKQHEETAEGYKAVVVQHENDHLDGILFPDRLSKLSLLKIKRKLKALESQAENGVNIRSEIYGRQVIGK